MGNYDQSIRSPFIEIVTACQTLDGYDTGYFLCLFTVWLALCLRLDGWVTMQNIQWLAVGLPLIRTLLKDLVPGYQPDGEVVDWVWVRHAKTVARESPEHKSTTPI